MDKPVLLVARPPQSGRERRQLVDHRTEALKPVIAAKRERG
ncbi:hypothetical protein [Streptomyces albiflavescens]|nr:hypothetical protein [Streptomyces albiflavescens]